MLAERAVQLEIELLGFKFLFKLSRGLNFCTSVFVQSCSSDRCAQVAQGLQGTWEPARPHPRLGNPCSFAGSVSGLKTPLALEQRVERWPGGTVPCQPGGEKPARGEVLSW